MRIMIKDFLYKPSQIPAYIKMLKTNWREMFI